LLLHPHSLRKFFRSNFVKAEIARAIDIVEELLGHDGYLNGTYTKFETNELSDAYMIAQKKLLIFDRVISNDEQQTEMDNIKNQLNTMRNIVEMMKSDWYHDKQKSHVIFEAIHPETGERYIDRTVPETDTFNDEQLLKQYIDEQSEMRAIKKLGLKTWAKLKRQEVLDKARDV